ncbi:MAG: molybdopterin molybdotransferase MoeA [Deltaproteobacteria bacterium]|nr:molybdopterin molybdotransferase MoeA [Deltaproteobacteria bacterium]
MIPVEKALAQILKGIKPLGTEKINILNALGRVLGEDITAHRNIPPKDNSAMDGYAVRWEDTRGATRKKPAVLDVVEDIPAGRIPEKAIQTGEAARIMTGAPIPEGADAVVRVEDSEKIGSRVKIFAAAEKGQDIRFAGEDVREGETIIAKGKVIRPAEIGMLAELGRSFISVRQRPLVAVLSTGDELVDIDQFPSPWQIISSNSYAMAAQVIDCGAVPLQIGIARDRRKDLLAKFQAALRADIIISSGGVSVGDYDLVKDIMHKVGNRMHFWQVAMRPGKPLAYGSMNGIPLFGLPGNPVSSMVSFEQFVRPAILKMMGHRNLYRKSVRAVLEEDLTKMKGFRHFIRGTVQYDKGRYTVSSTGKQGSGILQSMVRANCFIVMPENVISVRAGETVSVQLLDHSMELTAKPDYLQAAS